MDYEKLKGLSAAEQVMAIKKAMGMATFERPPKYWLSLRDQHLNRTIGSEEKGVAYGKTVVFAGMQSSGKSLLAAKCAGFGQQDGADVGWVDLEDSFDAPWVKIHGLDPGKAVKNKEGRIIGFEKVALFRPEFGAFKKGKEIRLEHAEETFEMAEEWMTSRRMINPKGKIVLVVDSTTAAVPEEEEEAGFTDQNMRSGMSHAKFLNKLTKKWNKLAPNVNAIIIYISQLRINPMAMFGNPEVIPGGKGILLYPHSINKVNRVKGGYVKSGDEVIGVQSMITNVKNKVGGGSVEGLKCGFRAMFQSNNWKFMTPKQLKALVDKEKGGE